MKQNNEGNWTEDFCHENGNYENECCKCNNLFIGHKRRVVCKKCSSKPVEIKKRIIIGRKGFGYSTMKRQHKYWFLWITVDWAYYEGNYRHFDNVVEEGKRKGYEIIYD